MAHPLEAGLAAQTRLLLVQLLPLLRLLLLLRLPLICLGVCALAWAQCMQVLACCTLAPCKACPMHHFEA